MKVAMHYRWTIKELEQMDNLLFAIKSLY